MKLPEQQHLFESAPYDRYLLLSKEELITLARQYEKVIMKFPRKNGHGVKRLG